MGILDTLANPGTVRNFADTLQIGQNMQARREQQQLRQLQIGEILQNMNIKRQEQERYQGGLDIISRNLAPKTTDQAVPAAQAPTQTEQTPEYKPGEPGSADYPAAPKEMTPEQGQALTQTIQQVPTQELEQKSSYKQIADELAAKGNLDMAKMFYDLQNQEDEKIASESEGDQKNFNLFSQVGGGLFKEIADLEDSGKGDQAKALWDQTIKFLSIDPRFRNNEKLKDLFSTHSQYAPGMAKMLYTSTMLGSKARQQFQEEQKIAETERHNRAMEIVENKKAIAKEKSGGGKFTKSDRVMQLANKIANNKASKEEKTEFDLLKPIDPIQQLTRQIIGRTTEAEKPASQRTIKLGNKNYEVIGELPDGKVKFRDPESGQTGIYDPAMAK